MMTLSQSTLSIRAYAKVNLALAVGAPLVGSSMHPICSWMHAIDLYDEIEISKIENQQESKYNIGWKGDRGDADKPVEWSMDQDLAVRAHRLVESRIGRTLGVQITVSKMIPAGGGLGGGSADAAAVVMGLNTLFGLGLDHGELVSMSKELGSDIAFFLDPDFLDGAGCVRSAIVEGFGDEIARLDSKHLGTPITLVVPGFGCHTGAVYQEFDQRIEPKHRLRIDEIRAMVIGDRIEGGALFNDLMAAAMGVAPGLEAVRSGVEAVLDSSAGQSVHLSGSGSTLFILGGLTQEQIRKLRMHWRVIETVLC